MKYRPRERENKTKKLIINLSEMDHHFLKVSAADNGITMTSLVLRALRFYFKMELEKNETLFK